MFLKIKQETIRKCHICNELLQAAPLNFSREMHLFLSVTRNLLMEKKKFEECLLLDHLRAFFKSYLAFKISLCAFLLFAHSPLIDILSLSTWHIYYNFSVKEYIYINVYIQHILGIQQQSSAYFCPLCS